MDKRLDEWTDIGKFDLSKGELTKHSKVDSENASDLSERKLTRNQKRKNDINSTVIDLNKICYLIQSVLPLALTC